MIILIITLYEHFSISNADNPPTCTGSQVCYDPPTTPQTTPISMFFFKFCWVTGITFPAFADVSDRTDVDIGNPNYTGSGTNGLTSISLINYPNDTCTIPKYSNGVGMWYLTTDTTQGSCILYQYNPCYSSSNPPQFCYAMLIFNQNNTNTYTEIVVNYLFEVNSLTFIYENVANGNNKKIIQMVMSPTNGENMTWDTYLECCDLTSWYNSLSISDQARVGTYNATFNTLENNLPVNHPTIANGNTMLNPTTHLPTVAGQNFNTQGYGSKTCFRNGSIWGATVTSYNYSTPVPGMPYYPYYF